MVQPYIILRDIIFLKKSKQQLYLYVIYLLR